MGPPTDIPPSELFLKLCESPRPTEVVDFPRYENGKAIEQIRIQVLIHQEHDRARETAHKAFKARGFVTEELAGQLMSEVVGDAVAREVLAMSCLTAQSYGDDENGRPVYARVFRSGADLEKLRPDEVAVLFASYMMVQRKFGPYEKTIESDADLNAWIKRLGEGASAFPLAREPLPQLAELAFLLGQRTYSLYAILASQWSSLPDTLRSALVSFYMDTGLYGDLVAGSTPIGGERLPEAEPVTTEQAARIAEQIKGV